MSSAQQYVVVHYGELSLKGRNRPRFLQKLTQNIRQALSDFGEIETRTVSGRMLVAVPAEVPGARLAERLHRVFGIANFSPCFKAPHDLNAIKATVDRALAERTFDSFRVTARRAFKELPFSSLDLNRDIGAHIMATHETRVDLHHPELNVHVELIPRQTLIYCEKYPGAGGLPTGISGTLLGLLSGGLDSPVAAYRMIKRGCHVDFVHFHSYPFLDRSSQDKARQLAQILTQYQYSTRLFLVPFGEIQQRIVGTAPPPDRVVLYRRCMVRIAEALAQHIGALALATGESLGQVASQTLANLRVIEAVSSMPILRPLIGMDKSEIMREAQAIGTFETSILPDQDCCTLFVPRHPSTRAPLERIEATEQKLDVPALVHMALDGVETIEMHFPQVYEPAGVVLPS
jgi:thiamine biosynthesis protein ThiI